MSQVRPGSVTVATPTTLMTREQLCTWWGVDSPAISRWLTEGLPEIKLSERLRFYDVNDVEEFIRTYAKNKAKD